MARQFDPPLDTEWLLVHVSQPADEVPVMINRQAVATILEHDPRPPDVIITLIAERAVKRMPVPNGSDETRIITQFNLDLVWPK